MAKKKVKGYLKKREDKVLKYLWLGAWHLVRSPYYLVRGGASLVRKVSKKKEKIKINRKRRAIEAKHEDFKVLHVIDGDYFDWLKHVSKSDSQIGIVLGARGSGKSAFGIKFLENFHAQNKKKCFAMGFKMEELPSWIHPVEDVSGIKNNSFVLIDEGGILFNSRNSMSNANKLLSDLIMVARHKNISILFISQNSSNLEINILRQADFLALKPSSLLQKDFERKIIQKIYESGGEHFEKFKEDKGVVHIYSGRFRGFVSNPLPSFWGEGVSKSFK